MTGTHAARMQRARPGALRAGARAGALALLVIGGTLLATAPALAADAAAPRPRHDVAGPAQASTVYTVQPGDTLAAIAQRFGTSVAVLAQSNRIANPDVIEVGQEITIPGASSGGGEPQGGGAAVYRVQSGDTLYAIAQRYGTTVQAIAQENGIANPAVIEVGAELRIPGGGQGGGGNNGSPGGGGDGAPQGYASSCAAGYPWGQTVSGPFVCIEEPDGSIEAFSGDDVTVRGYAGGTFENAVRVLLYDAAGEVVDDASVTTNAPQPGQPGAFEGTVTIPQLMSAGAGRIVAQFTSPRDGAVIALDSIGATIE
ncbi:MAG: LysM peptidoglycan-binding domain-containing protein [Dehalococcoidia bacterium]